MKKKKRRENLWDLKKLENTGFGEFEAVGSLIVEISSIFVFGTEQSPATDLLLRFLLELFSSLYIIRHGYSHLRVYRVAETMKKPKGMTIATVVSDSSKDSGP